MMQDWGIIIEIYNFVTTAIVKYFSVICNKKKFKLCDFN